MFEESITDPNRCHAKPRHAVFTTAGSYLIKLPQVLSFTLMSLQDAPGLAKLSAKLSIVDTTAPFNPLTFAYRSLEQLLLCTMS